MRRPKKTSARSRLATHWRAIGRLRFERPDGAVVKYDPDGVLTGSRPWLPGHRGWLAFGPGPTPNNVLGYYRRDSRVKVARRYRSAANARRAVDLQFPIGRPGDWRHDGPRGSEDGMLLPLAP